MLSKGLKKQLIKLKQKKYRKQFDEYIVEGVKGAQEAIMHGEVLTIVVSGSRRDEPEISTLINEAEKKGIPVEFAKSMEIEQIKSTDTFPGILAIMERPNTDIYQAILSGPIIALDHVNDPGNLGTIIRTADWFGFKTIVLSEGSVDPFNQKCVRSTMGSVFRVRIYEAENIANQIQLLKKEQNYTVCALQMEGQSVSELTLDNNSIYLFGSESHGIRPELAGAIDATYSIPTYGQAESLNLAMAAGIVMWNLKQ